MEWNLPFLRIKTENWQRTIVSHDDDIIPCLRDRLQ